MRFEQPVLRSHDNGDPAPPGQENSQQVLLVTMGMQNLDAPISQESAAFAMNLKESFLIFRDDLQGDPKSANLCGESPFIQ
jgi:hypothetical protein